jgi:hypothetical protein
MTTKLERLRKSWQDAENDIVGGDNSKAAEDYADYAYCAYHAELKTQTTQTTVLGVGLSDFLRFCSSPSNLQVTSHGHGGGYSLRYGFRSCWLLAC